MKTLRLLSAMIFVALLTCMTATGQTYSQRVVVTLNNCDYGEMGAPGIGVVSGTFTYHFTYKLSKDGYIKHFHWNVVDQNLYNENGDKVLVIDSGIDNLGNIDFWNTPDYYNTAGGWGTDLIDYDVEEGWLDDLIPPTAMTEGVCVGMSTKVLCKGEILKMYFMMGIHMNAHGEITAEVYKSAF